jgi:hypothetical protein
MSRAAEHLRGKIPGRPKAKSWMLIIFVIIRAGESISRHNQSMIGYSDS